MAERKGFDLSSVLKNVSSPDTGREQIEYIDIDLLTSDANNFYSLDGVSELAANIELIGLQQPLRVRQSPIDSKMYTIVSGHRRCAAIRLAIKEDGREDLRSVPCIVEQAAESSAMQELRLIYANADTRKMSSADISRQAERVEMLLYQLKEEGVEFPGRMRDHVAEACRVSKSKLARLKVIREKLIPEFETFWQDGVLNETVAYAIAQVAPNIQLRLSKIWTTAEGVKGITEWRVADKVNAYDTMKKITCNGGECTNFEAMWNRYNEPGTYHSVCRGCCKTCYDKLNCKAVCPQIRDSILEEKRKLREESKAAKETQKEKDRAAVEDVRELWKRLGIARIRAGMLMADCYGIIESYWSDYYEKELAEKENGTYKFSLATQSPYHYAKPQNISALASLLHVSIDWLFGATDDETRYDSDGRGVCAWQTGTPPAPGRYYCCFDCAGTLLYENAYWQGGDWYFGRGFSNKVGAECVAWYKLPEDMEA